MEWWNSNDVLAEDDIPNAMPAEDEDEDEEEEEDEE